MSGPFRVSDVFDLGCAKYAKFTSLFRNDNTCEGFFSKLRGKKMEIDITYKQGIFAPCLSLRVDLEWCRMFVE